MDVDGDVYQDATEPSSTSGPSYDSDTNVSTTVNRERAESVSSTSSFASCPSPTAPHIGNHNADLQEADSTSDLPFRENRNDFRSDDWLDDEDLLLHQDDNVENLFTAPDSAAGDYVTVQPDMFMEENELTEVTSEGFIPIFDRDESRAYGTHNAPNADEYQPEVLHETPEASADTEQGHAEAEMSEDDEESEDIDEEILQLRDSQLLPDQRQANACQAMTIKEYGNGLYKAEQYQEAVMQYTNALNICPVIQIQTRAVLYSNRAAAKSKLGHDTAAVKDCNKAIDLNPNYIKAIMRRAELNERLENLDEALEDYKKALQLDPSLTAARYYLEKSMNEMKK